MQIKFLGSTMSEYKGLDGKGQIVSLLKGDVVDVSEIVAKQLIQSYSKDFMLVDRPEHAPKKDKQLKKSMKFKSK